MAGVKRVAQIPPEWGKTASSSSSASPPHGCAARNSNGQSDLRDDAHAGSAVDVARHPSVIGASSLTMRGQTTRHRSVIAASPSVIARGRDIRR